MYALNVLTGRNWSHDVYADVIIFIGLLDTFAGANQPSFNITISEMI